MKTNVNKCTLNDILFDVEMIEQTDYECNSDYQFDIFAYPEGRKIRVNTCSKQYELVPNNSIFPPIRQILLDNNIQFTEQYEHINHARFYAKYIIENKELAANVGPNDFVKPQIVVQHSYNGLTQYSIQFGYFRLICSNGLTIPVKGMEDYNLSIKGKHTSSILKSFEQLNDKLQFFVSENVGKIIVEKYTKMYDNWIDNVKDRATEILTKSNITIVENSKFNLLNYIGGIAASEAEKLYNDNSKINDWLLYNAINRYIFDDQLNRKAPERRNELDSKVLETFLN